MFSSSDVCCNIINTFPYMWHVLNFITMIGYGLLLDFIVRKKRSVIGMKKILFLLSIVFAILTFVGAGYVLINKGTVNAGYAAIPMMISLACSSSFIALKNKDKVQN